jgi:hypothetical protein
VLRRGQPFGPDQLAGLFNSLPNCIMNPICALMSSIGQVAIPAFSHPARGACIINMYFTASPIRFRSLAFEV